MWLRVRDRAIRLLRRSEPYMKTDMVYLASGGFWLALGNVVAIGAGFALTYVFGNYVSKEIFGNYKYVLALAGLFGTITLAGMGTAITQAVARGFDGALRQGFRTYLVWSIPSIVVTLGGAAYYFLNENYALAISLLIVAVGSPILSASNLYSSFLQGKKDFKRSTVYGFVISIVPPLAIGSAILAGYSNWVPLFIFLYYLAIAAPSAYFHHRTLKIYRPSPATDPESVPYAVHLTLMSFLGRVASYIDKVLVFHFLGAASLAVYTFASAPPQYVLKFNGILRTLALPKLASRDIPTLKQTLPRKIALHFIAALAVFGVYELLVSPFFRLLFPLYIESIPYAQALGLLILSAPGVWLGQTLVAHMRTRELYIINTINPIVKIVLYVTLIPLYGIWGLVFATLGAGALGVGVAFWVYRQL